MSLPELFDLAINETLARTTITGLSTMLAVLALYILGGEVIRGFSLAMLWGIVIGTYSSICLAVPLMLYMYVRPAPVAGEAASKTSAGEVS
jgi:preprotein translocase subunit SecF